MDDMPDEEMDEEMLVHDEMLLTYRVVVNGNNLLPLPSYLEDVATVKPYDLSDDYSIFFFTVPKSWGAVLELYLNNNSNVVKYQLHTYIKPDAYLLCYHPESPNELYYITYLGGSPLSDYQKHVIFYIHTCGYKFVTKPIFMPAVNFERPFVVPENIKKAFSASQTLPLASFFLY